MRLDGDFMESVKLSRIAKAVNFKTSRTDMEFTRLDGNLNLDSGDLEANSLSGPLRLRTRSKDITINGVSGDVRLQNENGAVEIHVNKMGNMEITNNKGDIRVFVPQKAAFQLEAQTRDGEIIFGGDRQLVGYYMVPDPAGIEVNHAHAAEVLPLRHPRNWRAQTPRGETFRSREHHRCPR